MQRSPFLSHSLSLTLVFAQIWVTCYKICKNILLELLCQINSEAFIFPLGAPHSPSALDSCPRQTDIERERKGKSSPAAQCAFLTEGLFPFFPGSIHARRRIVSRFAWAALDQSSRCSSVVAPEWFSEATHCSHVTLYLAEISHKNKWCDKFFCLWELITWSWQLGHSMKLTDCLVVKFNLPRCSLVETSYDL